MEETWKGGESVKIDEVYVFSEELFLRAWRSDPTQDVRALSARCLEASFIYEEVVEAHKRLGKLHPAQAAQAPVAAASPSKTAKSKRARKRAS